jgi:hypothetical protein
VITGMHAVVFSGLREGPRVLQRAVSLRRVCGVDLAVAKQVGLELGLDRADRHEAAVRGS